MNPTDLLKKLKHSPAVPPGIAESVLEVSGVYVWQLIRKKILKTEPYCGARLVLVSSIVEYDARRRKGKHSKLSRRRQSTSASKLNPSETGLHS